MSTESITSPIGDKIKKFLYAMQVKGAQVCDGIEITADHELYTSDGTAVTSFVKDVEMVFGELAAGVFTAKGHDEITFDADGDRSDGFRHYLKLTRADGSVVYKLARGINDLIMDDADASFVDNLRDLTQQATDLQTAIQSAIDANTVVTNDDVDRLETAFDNYIDQLDTDLDYVKDEFLRMANVRDVQILTDIKSDLTEMVATAQNTFDSDVAHGEFSVAGLAVFNEAVFMKELDPNDTERAKVSNWAISAKVHQDADADDPEGGKILSDSIMYEAEIEERYPYAAGPHASSDSTPENEDDTKVPFLKITVQADSCSALGSDDLVVINAYYGGDMTAQDALPSHSFNSLSDAGFLYNADPAVAPVESTFGTIAQAASSPLPDSDDGDDKVQPMTRHNDDD